MEQAIILLAIIAAQGDLTATQRAAEAYTKQLRIDERVDEFARANTTVSQRAAAGRLASVVDIVVNSRIQLEWRF